MSSFLTLLVLSCFLVLSKYFYFLQLKLLANKLAAVLTVFTYIREITGSNFGRNTYCSDWVFFSVSFPVSSGKCRDNA